MERRAEGALATTPNPRRAIRTPILLVQPPMERGCHPGSHYHIFPFISFSELLSTPYPTIFLSLRSPSLSFFPGVASSSSSRFVTLAIFQPPSTLVEFTRNLRDPLWAAFFFYRLPEIRSIGFSSFPVFQFSSVGFLFHDEDGVDFCFSVDYIFIVFL